MTNSTLRLFVLTARPTDRLTRAARCSLWWSRDGDWTSAAHRNADSQLWSSVTDPSPSLLNGYKSKTAVAMSFGAWRAYAGHLSAALNARRSWRSAQAAAIIVSELADAALKLCARSWHLPSAPRALVLHRDLTPSVRQPYGCETAARSTWVLRRAVVGGGSSVASVPVRAMGIYLGRSVAFLRVRQIAC